MEALKNIVNRLESENEEELKNYLLSRNTIESMDSFLNCYDLKKESKKVLAVLYMKNYPLFTEETHDLIMKNEVDKFYLKVKRYCKSEIDDIEKDIRRVVRFYNAWYVEDVKMIRKIFSDALYENSL
tara:strand:- start:1640 stop:2020 length:381 start_codon:yes stop_codon:yes gene_type:complete